MKIADAIQQILPLLISKTVKRIEKDCEEGSITAYTMGGMIRIDIKPR